jgi:hypothetical protein
MNRYYFGDIEFGNFSKDKDELYPLAIIYRVQDVKEFETPAQAWDYYDSNGEFEAYVADNARDENDVQYTLVFKEKH